MSDTMTADRELWRQYLALSQEMSKFLTKQNIEMFMELLGQREKLQPVIEKAVDSGFRGSPEGRQLFASIQQENRVINMILRRMANQLQQNHTLNQAYDVYSQNMVGQWMDKKS